MERLTYVTKNGEILFHQEDLPEDEGMTIRQMAEDERWKALDQIAEKLANLEQMEELGLLVRLPCPIGTTVWDICGMDSRENVVSGIECSKDGKWFLWANEGKWLGELNNLVFLTREEAEKKLEELKNEI